MTVGSAFERLLDDASQFPPANLPLAQAWSQHRQWRASGNNAMVRRFLLPDTRAAALAQILTGDRVGEVELGVIITGEVVDGVAAIVNGHAPLTSIELRSIDEIPRLRERAPGAQLFVEGGEVEQIARMREHDTRVAAKLRCGGVHAAAFPDIDAVADFVEACVHLDVPFKATAGLHQPLRHWDSELNVHHHGFLNLWAGTAVAAQGAPRADVVHVLRMADGDAWREAAISISELNYARRWFTGFGTCSISEPIDGLVALAMVG